MCLVAQLELLLRGVGRLLAWFVGWTHLEAGRDAGVAGDRRRRRALEEDVTRSLKTQYN